MKTSRHRAYVTMLATLLAAIPLAAAPPSAVDDAPSYDVILGITEGPDPIPQILWQPTGGGTDGDLYGFHEGDGRPDVAEVGGSPLVVWADDVGPDHDVAFSRWTGTAWEPTAFLTAATDDEVDPRIFADPDGTVHVVWWVAGEVDTVFHLTRADGSWGVARQVTTRGGPGRRPSVAAWDGVVRISYERLLAGGRRRILLATLLPDGTYTEKPWLTVDRDRPLDAVLHAEQGLVWLDWLETDETMAYSVLGSPGWAPRATVGLRGTSWSEIRSAREAVRRIVLGD